jgi:hypothetical protein
VVGDFINIGGVILGAVSLLWLVWFVARPDHSRADEDAARDFFDRHGRWPDDPEHG